MPSPVARTIAKLGAVSRLKRGEPTVKVTWQDGRVTQEALVGRFKRLVRLRRQSPVHKMKHK